MLPAPAGSAVRGALLRGSSGLREQWGGDPLAEEAEKLSSLATFRERIGKDSDELVAFCFLRRKVSGECFTSAKRRDEVRRQLEGFETMSGLSGREARRRPNNVVSFLPCRASHLADLERRARALPGPRRGSRR